MSPCRHATPKNVWHGVNQIFLNVHICAVLGFIFYVTDKIICLVFKDDCSPTVQLFALSYVLVTLLVALSGLMWLYHTNQ